MSESGKKTDASEPSLEDYVISQDDMQDDVENIADEESFEGNDEVLFEDVDEAELEPVTSRRSLGWGGAIALTLIGSILGALGGLSLSRLMPPPSVAFDDAPLQDRLAALEDTKTKQAALISDLKADLDEAKMATPPQDEASNPDDVETLKERVTALEARMLEARTVSPTVNDPIASIEPEVPSDTDSETALNSDVDTPLATDDAVASPATPSVSFETFEAEVAAIKSESAQRLALQSEAHEQTAAEILALTERIDVLQKEVDLAKQDAMTAKDMAAKPVIVKQAVLLPAFPRDAIFEALTEVQADPNAGWLSKTLGRHITVRDPDDVDLATRQLAAIMAAIETDDIQEALRLTENLPPEGVELAGDWIKAAKRQ